MAKDPSARYPTCRAFVNALGEALDVIAETSVRNLTSVPSAPPVSSASGHVAKQTRVNSRQNAVSLAGC